MPVKYKEICISKVSLLKNGNGVEGIYQLGEVKWNKEGGQEGGGGCL
jgi:hypothetical protein